VPVKATGASSVAATPVGASHSKTDRKSMMLWIVSKTRRDSLPMRRAASGRKSRMMTRKSFVGRWMPQEYRQEIAQAIPSFRRSGSPS
jgi:hypothetical protein